MESRCDVFVGVSEVTPSVVVGESTNLYVLRDDTTTGGPSSTPRNLFPVSFVSLVVNLIQSLRTSVVVIWGFLWILGACLACLLWVVGHVVLSCVPSGIDGGGDVDVLDEVDSGYKESESSPKDRRRDGNNKEGNNNGGGGRKRRRRRKKTSPPLDSSCGSSSGSMAGDSKSDDSLPMDLKLETPPLIGETDGEEGPPDVVEDVKQQPFPICVTDEVLLDSSKSLLALWLRPALCLTGSTKGSCGQQSELDLQTSIRLQQIVDIVALQAFLGLHRDAEHLREHLTSLVCHEIEREKTNMALLNSIIEI